MKPMTRWKKIDWETMNRFLGFSFNHLAVMMGLVFVAMISLLSLDDVFAAPGTLTISIPDTISLDVLPSASGTFASTSSNITVRTTYAHGYTLGIAAKTANSNALINTNDSSKTIPSITSAISESTFSGNTSYNNKWGYSPSKYNSAANTNYLVAPTSTTMATLDKTSAANSTDNTYTIKLGARIDGTLAPGTYENTFVFTVTPNATPYTINYNKNTTDTVTNMPTPNPQTGETFATTVNISNTVPARDGYLFKGWCSAQVAEGATCSGTTYNPDGGGTSLSWTIDQTAVTNTLNLYAMWEPDVIIIMQDMSESDCVTSAPTRVEDARDGEIYLVQRLADGNCWLLDNLRLDPVTTPLATLVGNTNASATTLGYLKNGGGSTSDQYATAAVSNWTSSYSYSAPLTSASYKDATTTSYGVGSGKIGVYYNYCAASAGSYCYGNGTSPGTGIGDAVEDICPSGWRMPANGFDGGDYLDLFAAYNSDDSAFINALSTPLSGAFSGGSAESQGTGGFFWAATRNNSTYMNYLIVYPSDVRQPSSDYRYYGHSVRCVKKIPYMQDVTDMDLEEMIPDPGDTVTLADKRDNTKYLVGRLADGNVWMLDNLALDPTVVSEAILKGNTNASDTTIGYLKNGGGTSPYPATGVNTTWASSSDNKYDEPKVVTTYKDTTTTSYGAGSGKIGVYYNYCAASAGSYCYPSGSSTGDATEDLCPAGWRMPTGGTSGEYQTLYTAYSSNAANFRNALSTPLSGGFDGGSADGQGTDGVFLSSTRSDGNSVYIPSVDSNSVYLTDDNYRYFGYSMRCVKNMYMQDVTDEDLNGLIPNTGDTIELSDKRDNQGYSVARLADGKVWMTENLNLAGGTTISCDTSDCDSSYTIPTTQGWQSGGKLPASSTSGFNTNNYAYVYNSGNTTCGSSNPCYSYYSWDAATLGSGRNITADNTDAPYSICPKGWHLPNTRTGTNSTSDFRALMIALGGSSSVEVYNNGTSPSGAVMFGRITASPNYYRAGHYTSSGGGGFNITGFYLSSTSQNSTSNRQLYFGSNIVNPINPVNRGYGASVRCVKKEDSLYMQDVTSSSISGLLPNVGDNVNLVDKRDGTTYKVAKLADGNVWMLDNLALDPTAVSLATLQGNTNASNTTLNYLKNGGGTASNQYAITGVGNLTSGGSYSEGRIDASNKDAIPGDSTLGIGSRKVGVYYNFCAASAGSYCYGNGTSEGSPSGNASEDLCPSGWRLPTGGSSGEYAVLYNNSNYNTYTKIKTALSLPLAGRYYNGTLTSSYGVNGHWWSSTKSSIDNRNMNDLYLTDSSVSTSDAIHRSTGGSIRCILNP